MINYINVFLEAIKILFYTGPVKYFSILSVAAIFISGCGASVGKYVPDYNNLTDSIVSIDIRHPVKIINAQPSAEEIELEFKGITVDYHSFTQALADALKARFKAGMSPEKDSAVKELNVRVTKVVMFLNGMNYRAQIYAEINYGNNSTEYFKSSRASYASPFMTGTFPKKPLDAAFKDLVYEILKNKNIRDYLNL